MKVPRFRKLPASARYIFKALSDGEFHSGWDLAEDLKISKTAVWKMIQKIQADHIEIETHRRQGYRLKNVSGERLELLSEEAISQHLPASIREECEIFIYHQYPGKNFGDAFFGFRRPLVDLSICLVETMGTPKSRLGENLHLALAISDFHPALLNGIFDSLCDLIPSQCVDLQLLPPSAKQRFLLATLNVDLREFKIKRNLLAARVIEVFYQVRVRQGEAFKHLLNKSLSLPS